MENFPVFSKEVANEILTIVHEIFNAIDEGEFLKAINGSFLADMLFLNVDEQESGSDRDCEFDGDMNDWRCLFHNTVSTVLFTAILVHLFSTLRVVAKSAVWVDK